MGRRNTSFRKLKYYRFQCILIWFSRALIQMNIGQGLLAANNNKLRFDDSKLVFSRMSKRNMKCIYAIGNRRTAIGVGALNIHRIKLNLLANMIQI